MPRLARQRTLQRRSGPSLTNWARVTNRNISVAAGTKVLVQTFVLSNPGINETVRRTRGRFLFTSDQASAYEGSVPVFGMIVVNDLAIAAGAASIPGPLTDASDDGWFVWEASPNLLGTTDSSGATSNSAGFPFIEFDSKAMRKVPEGFAIAVMAEVAAVGVELTFGISLLTSRS